jgi:excisionase family DNA binding protein
MYLEETIVELKKEVLELKERVAMLEGSLRGPSDEVYLTTAEAARRLKIPRNTLLGQVRSGKIRAQKTCPESPRSRYKIPESAVLERLRM